MITIRNIGPYDDPDPGGERRYELTINSVRIGTFRHYRRDGLAVCLRKAAKCADRKMKEAQKGIGDEVLGFWAKMEGLNP